MDVHQKLLYFQVDQEVEQFLVHIHRGGNTLGRRLLSPPGAGEKESLPLGLICRITGQTTYPRENR
jgi:hypothetical protein